MEILSWSELNGAVSAVRVLGDILSKDAVSDCAEIWQENNKLAVYTAAYAALFDLKATLGLFMEYSAGHSVVEMAPQLSSLWLKLICTFQSLVTEPTISIQRGVVFNRVIDMRSLKRRFDGVDISTQAAKRRRLGMCGVLRLPRITAVHSADDSNAAADLCGPAQIVAGFASLINHNDNDQFRRVLFDLGLPPTAWTDLPLWLCFLARTHGLVDPDCALQLWDSTQTLKHADDIKRAFVKLATGDQQAVQSWLRA